MTDTESGKERRHQVERYRVLARETTDPLAWLALDMLSSYRRKPQPVLYDDPDHELVTARAVPTCEMSDEQAGGLNEARSDYR